MKHIHALASLSAALLLAAAPAATAQVPGNSAPQAVPLSRTIPDAHDVPYPGVVRLDVDATDTTRAVYRVKQTFPVPQGARELILQLPQWLPGNHGPRGPLNQLADIRFEAGGKQLTWTRDRLEIYAFHIALPAGAREVTATFVHTSPLQSNEGRISMTREIVNLQWEKMSLYPAGHYVRQIKVRPTVTFPKDWKVFTALDGQKATGNASNVVTWDTVDYETLVDSPIFAGKNAQRWDLKHGVKLDVVADEPGYLVLQPENLATFDKLADEAVTLFGARHFDKYHWLLALTDRLGGIGLEHQRSSENDWLPRGFIEWKDLAHDRNVVSHEIVHSWNGKYRRPAKMWTPDYRQPMQDNLLWMYEGQTQYWGWVLAARSGLQDKDTVLGAFANMAGLYSNQGGRAWRSVEDTTFDPMINARRARPYTDIHRDEDYYNEGMLVWIEADQLIRQGTGGAKSLDHFAKAFFGMNDGDWGQLTYEFEDIVAALNGVYPYDWATFLRTRLQTPGQPAPLKGIELGGYKLVWKDEPNPYRKGQMKTGKFLDLQYSLGINLDSAGEVSLTWWDSPAFNAGIVDGVKIVSVNGREYSEDQIKQEITAAKDSKNPIELIVKRGDRFMTIKLDYHGGLRYPWLERTGDAETGLDRMLAPLTGEPAAAPPK
jgi:predicted metalloprotease with PDZ domain